MSKKVSKARCEINNQLEAGKAYMLKEAFELLKKMSSAKFKESVEVSINLGIDPKKGEQNVRGAVDLPHGQGKQVSVAVFAQGDKAQDAQQAGADAVGMDDLAKRVTEGDFNFDVVIAALDAMPVVGKLGKILGPKGLMPNPKEGTVTDNISTAVKSVKSGRAKYRSDKGGIVHISIGKIDFEAQKLEENFHSLISDVIKAKPKTAKGLYLKKVTVSSTMGPGLVIDQLALVA